MSTTESITIERIDSLIRPIVGDDEDAYQDTYLAIYENDTFDDESIIEIAFSSVKSNRNNNINRSFKEISIDKPLNDDGFSLSQILEDTKNDRGYEDCYANHKPNVHGYTKLDEDVCRFLKERYPNCPINDAVRLMCGFPMHNRRRDYQPWEDELIKERYPFGGIASLIKDLPRRSRGSISQRALALGLRRTKGRPNDEWYSRIEARKALGLSEPKWKAVVRNGYIEPILVPGRKGRSFSHYFDVASLAKFMRSHTFEYDHESVSITLKHFVPGEMQYWKKIKTIEVQFGIHRCTCEWWIREGMVKVQKGYAGINYIDIRSAPFNK